MRGFDAKVRIARRSSLATQVDMRDGEIPHRDNVVADSCCDVGKLTVLHNVADSWWRVRHDDEATTDTPILDAIDAEAEVGERNVLGAFEVVPGKNKLRGVF